MYWYNNNIIIEYKQPTDAIDIILEAINNVKERTITFNKAFSICPSEINV